MKTIKKILVVLLSFAAILYLGLCAWFYTSQEKAIFRTVKHPADYKYQFSNPFVEKYIRMNDGKILNGVLFKAEKPKGLILWLPGGRGVLDSIGQNSAIYTNLGYDIFMLNFRGFGKSEGKIESEEQFNRDMQTVYEYFEKEYHAAIHVFGYSLGTGPAAFLAANNSPASLVLISPYYNFTEFAQKSMPYLPVDILSKYNFPTDQYLKTTNSPIYLIHGTADEKISVDVSKRLKMLLKPTDKLILLEGQKHNNFEQNPDYLNELKKILL
jgi:uncharacterized protein